MSCTLGLTYKEYTMHKLFLIGLIGFVLLGCDSKKGTFLNSVKSENDLPTAVAKLEKLIKEQGLTHFSTIDHQANAKGVNMNLKPETVVVFGNPKMGTVLMNCNPSMGLDLPLRILFTTDYEGLTTITYTNPEYWSLKHNIKDKNCLNIINKAKMALDNLAKKAGEK